MIGWNVSVYRQKDGETRRQRTTQRLVHVLRFGKPGVADWTGSAILQKRARQSIWVETAIRTVLRLPPNM